jgi:hypothetical protein
MAKWHWVGLPRTCSYKTTSLAQHECQLSGGKIGAETLRFPANAALGFASRARVTTQSACGAGNGWGSRSWLLELAVGAISEVR